MNIDKTPKNIMVGDLGTKKLIDAEKTSWVVGGSKPGVMTRRAKLAFEQKGDAEKFKKDNSGTLTSFEDTIKLAYKDMYQNTKMICEKRRMNRMEMDTSIRSDAPLFA